MGNAKVTFELNRHDSLLKIWVMDAHLAGKDPCLATSELPLKDLYAVDEPVRGWVPLTRPASRRKQRNASALASHLEPNQDLDDRVEKLAYEPSPSAHADASPAHCGMHVCE